MALLLVAHSLAATALAAPRVELEIGTQAGFPITGAQAWSKRLNEIGLAQVRIRGAKPSDKPSIETVGRKGFETIRLLGILTDREQLLLPGGRFSRNDMTRLKQYLETLQADGLPGVTEPKGAFGLTAKQLTEAVEDLTRPIDFTTQGVAPISIVQKAAAATTHKLAIERPAAEALRNASACEEEYLGLSSGTALAATLRPLGLILQPYREPGGATEYRLVVAKPGSQAWPIGWPPEPKDRDLLPKLYEFLTIELERIPLSDALSALQKRLEVPFLYDRNSLALQRIDPKAHEVSFPESRTYYRKVLDRILFDARMKAEVRVDEAGAPILWITTLKQ